LSKTEKLMTKLEEEIAKRYCEIIISNRNEDTPDGFDRVELYGLDPTFEKEEGHPYLQAAAEVSKRYIEKAYDDAFVQAVNRTDNAKDQWIKDNL
jgi:hypothetical protein